MRRGAIGILEGERKWKGALSKGSFHLILPPTALQHHHPPPPHLLPPLPHPYSHPLTPHPHPHRPTPCISYHLSSLFPHTSQPGWSQFLPPLKQILTSGFFYLHLAEGFFHLMLFLKKDSFMLLLLLSVALHILCSC